MRPKLREKKADDSRDLNLFPVAWSHCWVVEISDEWYGPTELVDFVTANFQNFPVLFLSV